MKVNMKINLKHSVISTFLATVFLAAAPTVHAQFVVIDPAAIVQATAQVTAWGQQLTAMKTQYDQAMTAYNSVKGITSFSDLLSNTTLMSQLPKEWQDVASSVKTTAAYATELAKLGTAPTAAGQARNQTIALNNAMVSNLFTQANDRLKNAQDLIAQIKSTSDPKEKQDLANQLAGAQAAIQGAAQVMALQREKQAIDIAAANDAYTQEFVCTKYKKC